MIHSDDSTEWTVSYSTPGEKTIGLTVTTAAGVVSRTISRTVDIFPTSVKPGGLTMVASNSSEYYTACFSAVFDMDEDGVAEAYGAKFPTVFMAGDAEGVYRPIDRMFNSHTYVGNFRDYAVATVDLNGDGMCDIVSPDFSSRYSKLYYGYNLGDMDMDFDFLNGDYGSLNNLYIEKWLDFDNDGAYDVYGNDNLWRNDGTYRDFVSKTLRVSGSAFADCNGDGLIDLVMGNTIYYNAGDFTFNSNRTLSAIPNGTDVVKAVEDFDNNGKQDFLYSNSGKSNTLCILWDDGSISDLGIRSGLWDHRSTVRDINNDGYPDILFQEDFVTILPGRTWQVYDRNETDKDVDGTVYSYFGRCFRGSDGRTYAISEHYQSGYYNTTLPNVLSVQMPNESPLPPSGLRHTQNDRFVVLEWEHSVDKETPGTQMRYNLSVKRKGANGAGAYLFSPANSGKNGVPVPSNKPLIRGNIFSIPMANIPAGEYEVMVQGVDVLGAQSDFSEVYNLVVTESAAIDMQTTGEVNVPVNVKVLVNYDTDIDFDGTELLAYASGVHTVVWRTPGTKTVNVGGRPATITIQPAPDGSFILPASARVGDRIRMTGKLVNQGIWAVMERVFDAGKWTYKEVSLHQDNKYFDLDILSATEAIIVPKQYNESTPHHFVSSRFSTQEYTATVTCPHDEFISGVSDRTTTLTAPAIDFVTADAATGKYKVQWTRPEHERPDAVGINVYKEGSVAGKYILLSTLPLETTEYVDRTSNPDVMAARYVLTYVLNHGESRDSKAHQPVHVMINRGAGSSWNLIWGHYEGATIPQYRILRGSSPDALEVIAEVSGNLTSYTDFTTPASGALYYAVETVLRPEASYGPAASRAATANNPRSNVIAAAGANVTFAESIAIVADEGTSISFSGDNTRGLQLRAIVNPTSATFGRVNWIVTSGDGIVTVDQCGYVTATGLDNGTATVRAQSIDGSGVYDEVTIHVTGFSGAPEIVTETAETISVYPSPAVNTLTVDGLTDGCDICIFSIGGAMEYRHNDWQGAASETIDCSAWPSGTYVVRVQTPAGTAHTRKFLKM